MACLVTGILAGLANINFIVQRQTSASRYAIFAVAANFKMKLTEGFGARERLRGNCLMFAVRSDERAASTDRLDKSPLLMLMGS